MCRPGAGAETPEFSLDGELLRFFDTYLMELETGLSREAPVHYFTMHGETWREAAEWPPSANTRRLFLAEGGALSLSPGSGEDRVTTDFGFGSGTHTRYGRLAAHDTRIYYDDWQPREAQLPCYRSEPLDTDIELAGHAVLTLHLAASEPDAALHVFLSEEEPDGTVRYVTEGVLRALHRKLSASPPDYRASWPYHSCDRGDAAPLVPGRAGRNRHRAVADRLAFRQGQPDPVGDRRRRRRPLRPGAARPPAGVHDQPGGLVS